jgi:DNA mismatch repair protein MutS
MAAAKKNSMTPMMSQYMAVKKQYPGMILLFRLGDFYEMFWDDAIEASRILGLTLTKRGTMKDEDIPMCGVPYHAAESYIGKLLQHRKRVAICEQVEDPRKAKGIVKREVTRVITPSTTFDDKQLTGNANNYLIALFPQTTRTASVTGIAILDITTGLFELAELKDDEAVRQELVRIQPSEILLPDDYDYALLSSEPAFQQALTVPLSRLYFDDGKNVLLKHFSVHTLDGFGCEKMTYGVSAAGAALRYVQENLLEASLDHIRSLRVFHREHYMILGDVSRRNLELTRALRDGSTHGTLLGVLDETVTPMGARMLLQWINAPLLDAGEIAGRQNAIESITHVQGQIQKIRTILEEVNDIERLTSRLSTGYGSPRDLSGLRASLHTVPRLQEIIGQILQEIQSEALPLVTDEKETGTATDDQNLLSCLYRDLVEPPELLALLDQALVDDPPLKIQDGGIIREGYNDELDELRALAHSGKDWIAKLQMTESERTGIKSLKVGYNKVFGYYIEVTKANLHLVPDDYIRKQTISTGERFVTPDLKEMESRILHAEDNSRNLEYDLFQGLRMQVAAENDILQTLARAIALLDVLQNLAWLALQRNYCRPVVTDSNTINITGGRHPVVERLLPDQQFVPNDTVLNTSDAQIMILTGPNMSGKSTYIRQVALLTLMAQMGSFIPAESAEIGIVDRIFTRVGASDELTRGQSTFMVEMTETANILNNATSRSLIILDEIGRGTSTYDGLSIAWSVVEYLHNFSTVKAKTLFATHYHELIQLEHQLSGVINCNVAVREYKDEVVFLHEIVRGGTDRSYGIHVAQLAGIPNAVIDRAKTILQHLEQAHQEKAVTTITETSPLALRETEEAISESRPSAQDKKPENKAQAPAEETPEEEPGKEEESQLSLF